MEIRDLSKTIEPQNLNPAAPPSQKTSQTPSRTRELLATVGPAYFPLAFISRLPFAMTVVGLLTFTASVRGSIAEAGLVSALAGVGTAIVGPLVGSLADKYGQRSVLLLFSASNVIALLSYLALGHSGAPLWGLCAVAFLVGASSPQVAAFARARLVTLVTQRTTGVRRARMLSLVMSHESVADETAFVLGPVAVGLAATALGAGAPLVLAAAIAATFVIWFALHPTGRPTKNTFRPEDAGSGTQPGSIIRAPLMILPLGMFLVGAFFGATLTALTVFMKDQGHELSTGIVYGGMSIGSVITAILIIFAPAKFSLHARWLIFAGLTAASATALVFAPTIASAALALAATGAGIGVTIVTLFSIANERTPRGRTTTTMTLMASSLVVGQALFTALGGAVSESLGSTPGFALAAAAAVVLAGLSLVSRAFGRPPRP
ncbi:MFS transporter [Arthrobacter alpinus]|uniref:MFS transporter n=1 Tax=Arthrobacter alpinus TaxID=656366 RepID=UPI0009FAC4CD|nr:MFS transporter [Arthrobacter alpinus]